MCFSCALLGVCRTSWSCDLGLHYSMPLALCGYLNYYLKILKFSSSHFKLSLATWSYQFPYWHMENIFVIVGSFVGQHCWELSQKFSACTTSDGACVLSLSSFWGSSYTCIRPSYCMPCVSYVLFCIFICFIPVYLFKDTFFWVIFYH